MNESTPTREELFFKEGLDPETATAAAAATRIPPNQRSEDEQKLVSLISSLIAENNRKLSES